MPRKPKKKLVESVEAPQVEPSVPSVEPQAEPKVSEPKPKVESLGTLGPNKKQILKISKKEVNGVEYNEVLLDDRATYLYSDEQLKGLLN